MAIVDLFSKKQKRLRREVPDVFTYDKIPEPLRVQFVHIISDSIGNGGLGIARSPIDPHAWEVYETIHNELCREYGMFCLTQRAKTPYDSIMDYLLQCEDNERVLDVIGHSFKYINIVVRKHTYGFSTKKMYPDEAIEELNGRFKEHGIGYQFESNELIRIDSTYVHSEIMKPAFQVLRGKIYKGANEEFLKAHEHYRHGRNKECLNECLKSFESIMKAICNKRKWAYNQKDTSQKLINICLTNNLIPPYMQAQFTSLSSLFESGIPTLRNKLGGHGQGAKKIQVSDTMASYALHLTATNILFLAENENKLK